MMRFRFLRALIGIGGSVNGKSFGLRTLAIHSLALIPFVMVAACGKPFRPSRSQQTTSVSLVRDIATDSIAGRPEITPTVAALWSGSRILIGDATAHAIYVLDSMGNTLSRIGTAGEGPGEFRDVSSLNVLTESTFGVFDVQLLRYTVFHGTGVVERVVQFTSGPLRFSFSKGGRAAFIRTPTNVSDPSASAPPVFSAVVWYTDSGVPRDSVAGVNVGRSRPMGPISVIAWVDTLVVVGTGEDASFSLYSANGTSRRVQLALEPTRVTEELYARAIDSLYAAKYGNSPLAARVRAQYLAIAKPDVAPYYRGIVADSGGIVWLLTSWPGDSLTTYDRVNLADGHEVSASFPRGVTILSARGGRLLGLRVDPTGTSHLLLFGVSN